MGKSKKQETDKIWIKLISSRLTTLRKESGYTSYESFAVDYDLDRKQYWRVENGANITLRTLIKILEIHKKDLPTFFKEIDSQKKK